MNMHPSISPPAAAVHAEVDNSLVYLCLQTPNGTINRDSSTSYKKQEILFTATGFCPAAVFFRPLIMRKILTTAILLFVCLASALAQKNPSLDSIRAAREQEARKRELRMELCYRQSPENAEKIKTLIERYGQESRKDSTSVIRGVSYIVRNTSKPADKLHFLKGAEGKYPDDINLLKRNALKKRLKKLLGSKYKFLIKNFNVQTPIEFTGGIYTTFGCRAHSCADTNFMIAYDFSKDILYAGIREDPQVTIYSESGDIPGKIMEWAN